MAEKTKGSPSYSARAITVLEGLDQSGFAQDVHRLTGPAGLHHVIWEVVDNSVDEAMAGYCTRTDVTLTKNGSCRVVDDGWGIPVHEHPRYKGSQPQMAVRCYTPGASWAERVRRLGRTPRRGVSVVNACRPDSSPGRPRQPPLRDDVP